MSAVVSFFSAAFTALHGLTGHGTKPASPAAIDGVEHRIAVLRVREGRIIEQSARFNGC